jgi:hypothetical protein
MKGTTRRKTTRTSGWLVAGCLLATVAAVPAEEAATVAEDRGMWEMAYGDVYYRVIGELKNASAKPLTYVKLEIDLLDAGGSDAFRIGIGKEEIPTKPKFKSYRVRIVEKK